MKGLSRLSLSLVVLMVLGVLAPLVIHGIEGFGFRFLTLPPSEMGRTGGVGPMIVSSFVVTFAAILLAAVIGFPTALFLTRHSSLRSRALKRWTSGSLELLAGVPSIVFGLFGHAFFCQWMGLGYSLLSGALTLCLMILPLFIRLVEISIQELPPDYFNAAYSLRLSQATWSFKVLLPMIWPSITVALILSWTRAIGETAALLFTAGYSMRWPESLMDSGRTLSVHIYDLSLNISGADEMAYRSAFVLMILTVVFVVVCRITMKGFLNWRLNTRL